MRLSLSLHQMLILPSCTKGVLVWSAECGCCLDGRQMLPGTLMKNSIRRCCSDHQGGVWPRDLIFTAGPRLASLLEELEGADASSL